MSVVDHGDPLPEGLVAGRYRLLRRVGARGIATVYAAEQVDTGNPVALELIDESFMQKLETALRFEGEAQARGRASDRIDNPHVLRVLDFGMDPSGSLYVATELLEGEVLRHVLDREGPLPVPRAIAIASDVAAALAAAHAAGVVHGDLDADDVFVTREGSVKVLDFGVAEVQAPPQTIEPTSDLCALGVLIDEMITGPTGLRRDQDKTPPRGMSLRRPDLAIPPALEELVRSLLAQEEMSASVAHARLREMAEAPSAPSVERDAPPEPERPEPEPEPSLAPTPPVAPRATGREPAWDRPEGATAALPLGAPPLEMASSMPGGRRPSARAILLGGAAVMAVIVGIVAVLVSREDAPPEAPGTGVVSQPAPGRGGSAEQPEQVADGDERDEAAEEDSSERQPVEQDRARLRITSEPSALIILDGEATTRRTPTRVFHVVPGPREITLRTDDGREHTERIQLEPGQLHRIDHTF